MKCLKYTIQEYHKNPDLFKKLSFDKSLRLATLYLDVANAERKLSEYKDAQRHLKSRPDSAASEDIIKQVFREISYNMHYGSLMFTRSKIFNDLGIVDQADADMYVARRVYEENIERGTGDYAMLRLATVFKEIGSRE